MRDTRLLAWLAIACAALALGLAVGLALLAFQQNTRINDLRDQLASLQAGAPVALYPDSRMQPPYNPPIYEGMTSEQVTLDEMLRGLLNWPTRIRQPPTDAQLGAAIRAAAANRTEPVKDARRPPMDFLARLALELDART